MSKLSIVMLMAGALFGSVVTMYGISGHVDQVDSYNSELWQKAHRLEEENHLLKIQVRTSQEELAQVVDRIPPNAEACWRVYRKSMAQR